MAIDTDYDMNELLDTILAQFASSNILPGDLTLTYLYELVKKKCNFAEFLTKISEVSKKNDK